MTKLLLHIRKHIKAMSEYRTFSVSNFESIYSYRHASVLTPCKKSTTRVPVFTFSFSDHRHTTQVTVDYLNKTVTVGVIGVYELVYTTDGIRIGDNHYTYYLSDEEKVALKLAGKYIPTSRDLLLRSTIRPILNSMEDD